MTHGQPASVTPCKQSSATSSRKFGKKLSHHGMPTMLTYFKGTRLIGCAKGFSLSLKGILGGTGFSLLRWEKGSETPSCGGRRGLRLPRSLGRSMRNQGVSDPLSHRKRESQTLFPTAKGKPRTSQNPLSENPLSATHERRHVNVAMPADSRCEKESLTSCLKSYLKL